MNFQNLIDMIFISSGSGLLKQSDFTNPTFILVLCETHFTLDCYPAEYHISNSSMSVEIKLIYLLSVLSICTIHFSGENDEILQYPLHKCRLLRIMTINVRGSYRAICTNYPFRNFHKDFASNVQSKKVWDDYRH